MTPAQREILIKYQQLAEKFAGYMITEENHLFIVLFEHRPEIGKPTPLTFRVLFDEDGNKINAGFYPKILSPNKP